MNKYKLWRLSNKEHLKKLHQKYYSENKEVVLKQMRFRRREIKLEVFSAYSKTISCTICKESHIVFLAIDHIDGQGNEHRKKLGNNGGHRFNLWLKKNNYPNGFRILCHNCNLKFGVKKQPTRKFKPLSEYSTKTAGLIKWLMANPDKHAEYLIRKQSARLILKSNILEHYGSKCVCCGCIDTSVLTIDHIDGGGTNQRKDLNCGGYGIYQWIIDNNFPPKFQILCMNCNMAKHHGGCPHIYENVKPMIKWCGGKRKMFQHISDLFPTVTKGTYYEPFLGGGAIFFELRKTGRIHDAVLSDKNQDLISCYIAVRDKVDLVLNALSNPDFKYGIDEYLKMRAKNPDEMDPVEAAARFIYLNKTGFNGLYRVNKNGKFNVPFGKYKNPVIADESNLRAVSSALHNTQIFCCDFSDVLSTVKPNDSVFLDPPYIAVSKTSNFSAYTTEGFTDNDHKHLSIIYASLIKKGVSAILMNSTADKCFELYPDNIFTVKKVFGQRSVGGSNSSRKKLGEIIVSK